MTPKVSLGVQRGIPNLSFSWGSAWYSKSSHALIRETRNLSTLARLYSLYV